jgi:Trypsin-like serine proteases, typically periplasmic, contain C-terminal PDZ domain
MLRELSEESAALAAKVGRRLVHIGGEAIAGRTGIVRNDGIVASFAREAEIGEQVELIGPGGEPRPSVVRAWDEATGLALLEPERPLDAGELWRIGDPPGIGALVLTLAYPSSAGIEASLGTLRFRGESTAWGDREAGPYFQTSSSPFPGFAGAALLDAEGALVGVIAENKPGNWGFVIGARAWDELAAGMLTAGARPRPKLGVSLMPARLDGEQARAAGRDRAALVVQVRPGSAAQRAGVLVGDILLELGGKALDADAASLAARLSLGEQALVCLSGGARVERIVAIGEGDR